ncbi:MAG: AbiV family abortive infection protein [Thalassospira sp.]|uniref:AbiV family abortive infection protein n=1 Tax=Thalassospira sp. TaxID=1912094 RepID=UPI0032EEA54E
MVKDHIYSERESILQNSTRLIEDAETLASLERYSSAFALAVLGLEEVGKVVLLEWDSPKPNSYTRKLKSFHVQKQLAVACLVQGYDIAEKFRDWPRTKKIKKEQVRDLAKYMYESHMGLFERTVSSGRLDKIKHCALYFDSTVDEPIRRTEDFTEEDVSLLFTFAQQARMALDDNDAVAAGRAIYINSPI